MSHLILKLKARSPQRIDASGLLPSSIASGSRDDLSNRMLPVGNRNIRLADLFDIEGSPESVDRLVFQGATDCIDAIGKGLESGHIEVEGSLSLIHI